MYEIDKSQFGAFIAALRKDRGWTQRELAERLHISDKAVSKWETGVSIPDTALLIPLAELFDVTVTELLMCRKMERSENMEQTQVENIVKAAIAYPDDGGERAYQKRSVWHLVYFLALALCAVEMFVFRRIVLMSSTIWTAEALAAVFGAYFCFFAKDRLPNYYDEYRISSYSDGFFRMNMTGLAFNNRNWPHILNAGRVWCAAMLAVYPLFHFPLQRFLYVVWPMSELGVMLFATLGGLFLPIYIVGKKYE